MPNTDNTQHRLKKKVAVLMGGFSRERDVSLSTGQACSVALQNAGYDVTCIDVVDNHTFMKNLTHIQPDVIFNALHGFFGEDGQLPALLNTMNIPYTHSGVHASQVAMNKGKCQKLFKSQGLPTAQSHVATQDDIRNHQNLLPIPFVVKAICEGSSIGIHIVKTEQDMSVLCDWNYGDALIENYISGREFTCTVLNHPQKTQEYQTQKSQAQKCQPMGITELITHGQFYDYDAKYSSDPSLLAHHICPANIPQDLQNRIFNLSKKCHHVLGCRGISRTDFIWNESTDTLVILETNTHPGMTPTSHAPEQALVAGYSFEDLVTQLVETAQCD